MAINLTFDGTRLSLFSSLRLVVMAVIFSHSIVIVEGNKVNFPYGLLYSYTAFITEEIPVLHLLEAKG